MGDTGAGVVNRSGVSGDAAFGQLLVDRSDDVRAIATAIRDLVYDVLPDAVEVVWLTQGSVGWGSGPKKFTEQFAYLMPFKKHVTLGFYYGGDLPDPHRLLPMQGGRQAGGRLSMRSVKLATLSEVENPSLRTLITESTTRIPRSEPKIAPVLFPSRRFT